PRRPDYRLVEVDRGRFASLPAADLAGLDLVLGAEIAPLVFERLQELADLEAAHRAAVRAVARRAHARFDLRRRLLQKPPPPAPVRKRRLVAFLVRRGFGGAEVRELVEQLGGR